MTNKFADWMKNNDKKQRAVAEKLDVSTSTLHAIIKKGQMPSLLLAYEIEKYTKGAITLYDWVDQSKDVSSSKTALSIKTKTKKIVK